MDYNNTISNLKEIINIFESADCDKNEREFIQNFIIKIAEDKNFDIHQIEDSIYIKKGDNPKAIIHLNIERKIKESQIALSNDQNYLNSSNDLNYINSLLVIYELLKYSDHDFDVLITNNNIQTDNKDYQYLYDIIRSKNVINLNLRQSLCLADEFSSLILSKVNTPIERFIPDYDYKIFRLSLSKLIGGHTGADLDKVRLNSIKALVSFIRKVKAKVDLDIINLEAGSRYDRIPDSAFIEFIIKSDYDGALFDSFNLIKNESIEKNLKHEPDMNLSLEEIDSYEFNPVNQTSFEHLASFVELVPTGAYAVDNITNELISSLNLSISRTTEEFFNFIIVYRSLTDESMKEMLEKTSIAAKISFSNINSGLVIPRWKNSNNELTSIFRDSFMELTGEELNIIKTQYSLDSSIIFNKINVNLISLGVEYKQGEDGNYYSLLSDMASVIKLMDNSFSHLAKQ